MGRREGTEDQRIFVKVSPEMVNLRIMQTQLNRFLWSTEISQLYAVDDLIRRFPDGSESIEDALSYLKATAFYKNNQGRLKYTGTVNEATSQITENMPYLYRSVLTYFASAFENYLIQRIGPLLNKIPLGWGPYYNSLNIAQLQRSEFPVPLESVIAADFCRIIRNSVVHPPFELPENKKSNSVVNAKDRFTREIKETSWQSDDVKITVNSTVGQIIGSVISHVNQAPDQPSELFFCLFNFTTLDKLAFQIEEALMDKNATEEYWVSRKGSAVRRRELEIQLPEPLD